MTESELLEDLADAIVTARPIDWDAAEASSSPDVRSLLRELRVVAGIAALHRTWEQPPHAGSAVASSGAPAERTDHWGPLRLIEQVGTGASGTVYRAWDERLDREVALKLLRLNALGSSATVLHEGRLLARLRHPNIVAVYGAEEYDGRAGLWMEFVEGQHLESLVRSQGPLPISEAVEISVAVCGALQAVHDAGLLHRDLKAQNVIRDPQGRVVLMDFHAGRDAGGLQAPDLVGTPMYLAPEILLGYHRATAQSDVYSAAVLTFWLLTGAFPFNGRTLDELRQAHRSGLRTSLRSLRPELPSRVAAAVERGLADSPVNRPSSAEAFATGLSASLGSSPTARTPQRWWAAAVVLVVGCAAAVSLAVESGGRGRPRSGAATTPLGSTLTMSELDWKDFIPLSAPTPDGRLIAGAVALEPAVKDLGSGEVTVLQHRKEEDDAALPGALSPDGRALAYGWNAAQPDGSEHVEIRLSEIGSGRSRAVGLRRTIDDVTVVAWMPDFRSLLTIITAPPDAPALALVDLQTGQLTSLHVFSTGPPLGASLSLDGAAVVFDQPEERDAATRDIWLLEVSTGRARPIVVAPSNDLYPCWLPDGRAIAFASDRGGTLGLWRLDLADSGSKPELVKESMGRFAPIGFTAAGDLYFRLQSTVMDLYRWPLPEGGEPAPPTAVVSMFVGQNLDGDWSPDGRKVAYVSRRGDVPFTRRSMSLVVRDLATGRERRTTPDADGVHDPRWSPDGAHVVFSARVGSVDRLRMLSTRDYTIRELAPPATLALPQWSSDGERLYGTAGHDGKFGIRVRTLATGAESELAWPVNMAFAVSHDERWLATSIDDKDGPAVQVRAAAGGPWHVALQGAPGDRLFVIGWTSDDTTLLSSRRLGIGTDTITTEIWATPLSAGVPGPSARVGVLPGYSDARKFRLSPDGRELLFTAGSSGFSTWQMKGIE